MLIMAGALVAQECERQGVTMIHEGYVDLDYRADGSLVLERKKAGRDPRSIADRAVRMLEKGGCETIDGTWLSLPVQSICLHGDGPNAVELARTVRERIVQAGYELVGIRTMCTSAIASTSVQI
jgi:UPF0271 protein